MNNRIKIEKRMMEEIVAIRKMADFLPPGQRNALLNKCGRLTGFARKAQSIADAAHYPEVANARYDARTQDDIACQMRYKEAVFEAMKNGRKISLHDGREFHIAEMHTTICGIRKDIRKKGLPWTLCDEWVRPKGGRPYKVYWLVETPQREAELW